MRAHALSMLFAHRLSGRLGFLGLTLIYALLVAACFGTLAREDELSLGRNPLTNLVKTAGEFAHPSFLDLSASRDTSVRIAASAALEPSSSKP